MSIYPSKVLGLCCLAISLLATESHAAPAVDERSTIINLTVSMLPVDPAADMKGQSQQQLAKLAAAAQKQLNTPDRVDFHLSMDSGTTAEAKRIDEFWYPTKYSDPMHALAKGDTARYPFAEAPHLSPNDFTILLPPSPTEMSHAEIGHNLKITATTNRDGTIRLKGVLSHKALIGLQPVDFQLWSQRTGKKKQAIADPARLYMPLFHDDSLTIDLPSVRSRYYLPYSLPLADETDHAAASSQTPVRSQTRPAILVLEASHDRTMISDTAKRHQLPANNQMILLACKFIEHEELSVSEVGTYTEPEIEALTRQIQERRGTDLMAAPSAVTQSAQQAKIEVIQDFNFPSKFSAPKLSATNSETPITPASPESFQNVKTGVTLEAKPSIAGHDRITVRATTTVREFKGFAPYGNPIHGVKPAILLKKKTKPSILAENDVQMPVFSIRQSSSQVTIPDSSSVALSIVRDGQSQQVGKKRLLRLREKTTTKESDRHLTVILKAQLFDSSGEPLSTPASSSGGQTPGRPLIVPVRRSGDAQ